MNNILRILVISVLISLFLITFSTANEIEKKFNQAGLVDIHSVDKSIQVDLVNSNPSKNYFRENFYKGLKKAYLRHNVAVKLSKAQQILQSKNKSYTLLILDAARPRSVSKKMYDKMKNTPFEKFVANPQKGSMHNYGVAVDITIEDINGNELDMGFTPFRKNSLELYWLYLKKKLGSDLSNKQRKNRKLLADVMKAAGFYPLSFEWWHFNGLPKAEVREKYQIIE